MVQRVTRIFAGADEVAAIATPGANQISDPTTSIAGANVRRLTDTARESAQANAITRDIQGRTSASRRINNSTHTYQYNAEFGEYVAADSGGGAFSVQGMSNALATSNENVLNCGQTRTAVWKVKKV